MDERIAPDNRQIYDSSYLERKNQEACQIDSDNKRYSHRIHYINLQAHTSDKYYDSLKDWREMESFKEPKKKYANQDAGISFWLRIRAFFNGDAKSELETKKKQAEAIHEAETKAALDSYNKRAEHFHENRKQQHDSVNKLHEMMHQGDAEQIAAYFAFALNQDDYSTDFVNQFQIDVADVRYNPKKKQLCYAYRIPNTEEILAFSSFVYDTETDSIQPKPIDAKHQLVQRTHIMHRILLRSLIMAYESDEYGFLDDVEITGFLGCYDPSYGTIRRKDVVKFHMNRSEYAQTDFEKVDVETLFSVRLKPMESTGLYTKKAEEISDIYTVKGKNTSNTKAKTKKQ
jgi:hypothetical protein